MGLYLNPGNEGFRISVNDDIYVDKSGMIAYINSVIGKRRRYLCVSRPRRFGKSMAAEMLCAYYDRSCDSRELFDGLEITKDTSYEENRNKYDVILLNVQHFLRKAGKLNKVAECMEREVLAEIKEQYPACVDVTETHLPDALAAVFAKEQRAYKGFIFILDEWDCIFREAKEDKEAQRIYLDFLRDLFKDRTYVKLAYMTGILPIKKYGTHSALNIFDEISMTNPSVLAEYMGFTEGEVQGLCQKYEMDFDEAKCWYDGYCLKKVNHVYNPKSIIDAMLEGEYRSYWTSTETYEALRIYIDMNLDGLRNAITAMLGGIRCRINARRFQNDMTTFESKDDVLTLLVHLGYLAYNEEAQEVFIPNMEIAGEFMTAVEGTSGWEHVCAVITRSDELLAATLRGDAKVVEDIIDIVHTENTSILSYNDENSLSCVIALAYFSAKKECTIVRELTTGKGFADMVFIPRRSSDKPAIVVELKWDNSAEGAIGQIKNRQYGKALEEYEDNLLLVGINYDRKTKTHSCVIEKFE